DPASLAPAPLAAASIAPMPVAEVLASPGTGVGRIALSPGHELTETLPDGHREQVSSMLAVGHPMQFGDFVWNDRGVPPGRPWVRVDLDRQLVSVFRSGQEIGTAVILYGAQNTPTPLGWHRIIAKARDHYSRSYDAPMPYMLQLTADGVALHASLVREGKGTHGCIGLPHLFAARLFETMERGDPVLILGAAAARS
ncbi:MAG TPA: L,D-transpeptidase family protein, partial [Novosphingobium sp.]|nr:L,D-transpeptidase family protein [Novosphingobium sp.]